MLVRKLVLLLMLASPLATWAQATRVVKGKVLDEKGMPLPGASVFVDQTIGADSGIKGVVNNYNLGVVSDVNGNFSLTIPKGVTMLTCSFISYETQKVDVNGKDMVTIKMKESNATLEQVIVTGYQNIKERKITSAVAKIEAKDIKQIGVASIDQMLSGQIAGVQTTVVNGAPGAPTRIRIRGTASLSGTQDPLWVLDGMPLDGTNLPDLSGKNIDNLTNSSLAGLNPNDIADITILKDAAATAIYGTRAANGVIVITTKKGKAGSMNINLSSNMSMTLRPDFSKLNLLNSNDKVDLELALAARQDLSYRNDKGAVASILNGAGEYDLFQQQGFSALSSSTQAAINKLRTVNTNWGRELYRNAVNQDHSLSISGGNERLLYYFSVGYYDEKGTTTGTSLNRINLTYKTDFQVSKKLKFGVSLYTNQRKTGSYLTGTSILTNPANYSRIANPYQPVYNENGKYAYDPLSASGSDKFVDFNIIEERNNTSNTIKAQSLNTIFDVNWEVMKDIKFSSQLGIQYDISNAEQVADENSYYARLAIAGSEYTNSNGDRDYFIPNGGVIKNTNDRANQWNWKSMLEINKQLAEKHEIDFMVGSELRRVYNNRVFNAGYGYDPNTLATVPVIFPTAAWAGYYPLFNKTYSENAFVSFFTTASYTYDRRYTLFGSLRYDGSDLYGVDPKYKYLPLWSAGGAWNVSQEEWMQDISWISTLKLRASYGLQGNIDKTTSPFLIGDRRKDTNLPGITEDVLRVTGAPNGLLRWEKTTTWNGGIDFGVFKNRIVVGVDLYHRLSSDLIGLRSIPLETGFAYANQNWAQVTNKGFEVNLTTRNIISNDFSWSTNFNISKNINNVDKYEIREDEVTPSLQGYPVNALFAFKTAGLDEYGYPMFMKNGKKVTLKEFFKLDVPWDYPPLTYSALSSKELRDSYTYMGSQDPLWSGGMVNTFKYKNFTLNISMSFNLKQWVKEQPFYSMTAYDRGTNTTGRIKEVWSPTNTSGKYPAIVGENTYNGERASEYYFMNEGSLSAYLFSSLDIWYKEVSYLRVSSIRLSYDIPEKLLEKMKIKGAKVNVEARNPFVFGTSYNGYFDPETYGNIYAQPVPRMISVGLNVNF